MKKLLFIAILIKLFVPMDKAQGAYSSIVAQVTQGTGITVTGAGTQLSPYVISSTATAPTFNNTPSVTLNSSSTKNAAVSYSVSIATAVSLLNLNSSGQAFLEISPNNSTWTEINRAGVTRTLSVAIAVGVGETTSYNLQGQVPAGYWRRIRTATSGGGLVSMVSGQEVQY